MPTAEQADTSPTDADLAATALAKKERAALRRFAPIDPDLVCRVIAHGDHGDGPDAFFLATDALARRFQNMVEDELRIASARRAPVFGTHRVTGAEGKRPYETTVFDLEGPAVGSCTCPDFLRSGLGLCKHLFAALRHAFARPNAATAVRRAQGDVPVLRWDWRRPAGAETDPVLAVAVARMSAEAETCADALGVWHTHLAAADTPATRLRALNEIEALLACYPGLSFDPAYRAVLAEEIALATRRVAAEAAAERALSFEATLLRPLYPYQREGIATALRAGRFLLADDMGLGKTTQATAFGHLLYVSGAASRGLIVCPASLRPQWEREWQSVSDVPITRVDGPEPERRRIYERAAEGFLLIGYETLLRDLDAIRAFAPDVVMVDEGQRIKNYATATANAVKALTPQFRLLLTGTPLENRLEELASLLDWIDDRTLAPKWRLASDYGAEGGMKNLGALRSRLAPRVLRRVRREVASQLPPRTDTRIPIAMTAEQLARHDEANQPIARLMQTAERRPLTPAEFLKLMTLFQSQRVLANGVAQADFEAIWPTLADTAPTAEVLARLCSPKLGELRRLVDDLVLEQGRTIIVFSQWKRMLRLAHWAIGDLLAAAGLRATFFTGDESKVARERAVRDLHDDPAVKVMFLTDAGGVGLNLQEAATACIHLELPWNPAVLEQRTSRIYRLGQREPVDIYHLVSEGCIESRIARLIANKRAVFDAVFQADTDEVTFEGSASFLDTARSLIEVEDAAAAPASRADEPHPEAPLSVVSPSASEPAALAPEAAPAPSTDPAAVPSIDTAALSMLFASMRISRGASGEVRLEAPPEAAGALAAVFEGLAGMLRAGVATSAAG